MNNIISFQNVDFVYHSGTKALCNISINIPRAKKIALIGENGAGKSTLMLHLNGILKPTNGKIFYNSNEYQYSKKELLNLRKNVGFLFHDPNNQLIAPTVYEEITFGLCNISSNKEWIYNQADAMIDEFCLHELKNRSPHELSAGQKKRVCLASIIAMEPELIICDEPTATLDPKNEKITFNILNRLNKNGKTILISTHDVNQAYEWADFVILMSKGSVIDSGLPNEVFANEKKMLQAGFEIPHIIKTCLSLKPDINKNMLPKSMDELNTFLSKTICKA